MMEDKTNTNNSTNPRSPVDDDKAKKEELIKTTVERVLSKDNLRKEPSLVSNMNSQMYLPIASLFNLGAVSELNTTPEGVASAISSLGSDKVSLDSTKTMIKPCLPELQQRTTLIVRDVDSKSLSVDDFKNEVLKEAPCDKDAIVDIRPDVNDHWYVRFTTEDACEDVALWLRNQKYNGNPIHTAVKAEHFMLTLFPDLEKNSEASRSPALSYGSPAFVPSSPGTPYQGYSAFNPYAGVDQYGYYHPSAAKGKGKGRGKGVRGRRRMSSAGAAAGHPTVEQIIDPADLAGDETKYKYDFRKYSKSEIQKICDAMPAEAVYKPEGMVKAEKQAGEGLIRDTPNRERIVEGSPVSGGGRKSSSASAAASPAVTAATAAPIVTC